MSNISGLDGAQNARPEFIDDAFIHVADSSEARDAGLDEFARKANNGAFVDGINHLWRVSHWLDDAGSDVVAHVVIADLVSGLGEHLMTTERIRFSGRNISFANVAVDDASKLDGNEIKELSGVFGVDFAVEVPSTAPFVTVSTRADTVDNAALAGLAEDFARHGAVKNVVETIDSVLFLRLERALNNEAKAKADIAGVFATDENWLSARVIVDWHVEFFALFEIPIFEHLDDFLFATAQAARDNKLHIIGGVGAAMMFANVLELDIINGFETLGISEDFFAQLLLELWPDETTVIVLVAGQLGTDVTLLAGEFFFVEFWQGDGKLLKLEDALPLKIGTFSLVGNKNVRSPGVVIGAVFGKFGLVGLLVLEELVAAESHVLHKVCDFVDFGLFDKFVASAKNHADVHDARTWSVNEKAASAVFEIDFFDGMLHKV